MCHQVRSTTCAVSAGLAELSGRSSVSRLRLLTQPVLCPAGGCNQGEPPCSFVPVPVRVAIPSSACVRSRTCATPAPGNAAALYCLACCTDPSPQGVCTPFDQCKGTIPLPEGSSPLLPVDRLLAEPPEIVSRPFNVASRVVCLLCLLAEGPFGPVVGRFCPLTGPF